VSTDRNARDIPKRLSQWIHTAASYVTCLFIDLGIVGACAVILFSRVSVEGERATIGVRIGSTHDEKRIGSTMTMNAGLGAYTDNSELYRSSRHGTSASQRFFPCISPAYLPSHSQLWTTVLVIGFSAHLIWHLVPACQIQLSRVCPWHDTRVSHA